MKSVLFITDLLAGSRVPELAGIRTEAATRGWHVEEIELARLKGPVEKVISYWNPVGCIVEGSGTLHPAHRVFGNRPVVWIDPPERILNNPGVPTVANDNAAIADLAFKTLTKLMPAAYAFIGWAHCGWSRERGNRFVKRLKDLGKACHVHNDPWTLGNKADFASRLRPFLARLPRPCGIFAVNDAFASVILDICKMDGITVPGDFFIVGVDDDPTVCDHTTPSLSSVRPNFTQGGQRAARLLASGEIRKLVFSPLGITERLSTRRISRLAPRLVEALDLIRREACNGLKASDVVRAIGVTERLAETRFKAATGKRITEEITDVRFERVFQLLSTPNQTLGSIANFCGWDSDIYLRRLFKSRTGLTMTQWRKRHSI